MIPKIIHFTWKTKKIPLKYRVFVNSIIHHHSGWEIKIWTHDNMQQLVAERYPEYQENYLSYPKMIQRCDFFRLLVINHFGGIYSDLDVSILKSFDELDKSIEIFFPCEKIMSQEALIRCNNRDSVRIGTYTFGSVPKHPFLKYLVDKLILPQYANRPIQTNNDIMESTGSGIITTLYHDYIKDNPDSVTILYPQTNNKSHCRCRLKGSIKIATCKIGDFGNHYHQGTWRVTTSVERLYNFFIWMRVLLKL